jgi:hypothetical protein
VGAAHPQGRVDYGPVPQVNAVEIAHGDHGSAGDPGGRGGVSDNGKTRCHFKDSARVDGSFEIAGLFGRRMLQLGRFDSDWRIQSVMHGKSDVTSTAIDVAPNATAEVTIVVRRR